MTSNMSCRMSTYNVLKASNKKKLKENTIAGCLFLFFKKNSFMCSLSLSCEIFFNDTKECRTLYHCIYRANRLFVPVNTIFSRRTEINVAHTFVSAKSPIQ